MDDLDIVEWLRKAEREHSQGDDLVKPDPVETMKKLLAAADEIERLRKALLITRGILEREIEQIDIEISYKPNTGD